MSCPVALRRGALREPRAGAGARLDEYLDSAHDAYELAVSRFLYDTYASTKGLRSPAVAGQPRLAPLLTRSLHDHVARRFSDPVLRQILGYPAVFLGSSPFDAPSLYHLMSHLDLDEGVLYPQGGFTEVIAAVARVAEAQGATLHTSSPVAEILTQDARAIGIRLADGTVHEADIVVSSADLHATETTMLPASLQTYPQRWWRRRNPGPAPSCCCSASRANCRSWLTTRCCSPATGRRTSATCSAATRGSPIPPRSTCAARRRPTHGGPGGQREPVRARSDARRPVARARRDRRGRSAPIEEAADRVIAQIAAWTGIPDLAARIRVRRTIAPADFEADLGAWRGGALGLAHTLAQSAVFRPRNASRKVGGLFYAGTSVLPGIGLPMCLISAELVVKRLRGDDGAARLPEPSGVGAGRASAPAETTPEMPGAYLLILLVSLGGIIVLDARFDSCCGRRPTSVVRRGRAIAAVLVGTVFFLAWDAVGIATGVFVKGDSPYLLGIDLAPHLPVEEPVFLAFLCYLALVVHAAVIRC
jgi:lycopene cyclase domain-containing protein